MEKHELADERLLGLYNETRSSRKRLLEMELDYRKEILRRQHLKDVRVYPSPTPELKPSEVIAINTFAKHERPVNEWVAFLNELLMKRIK